MKKKHPFPVTPDNFSQCWEFIDKNRRIGKRQALISAIGGFTVNLLFLLSVIFAGCGLIYTYLDGSFCAFWETLPFFPVWQEISAALLTPGAELSANIGRLLGAAYLVSIAAFVLLAVLVWVLYHPFKAKLPAGTYEENTALLAKNAQKCRDYTYKTRLSTSIVGSVLAILTIFTLFIGYVISVEDPEIILLLLGSFPTQDLSVNSVLYVMVLYLFSSIFSSVLLFVTRPFYRYDFSYDLVVVAERGAIFAREQYVSLTPEELEAKSKENAVTIRDEAISLEKERAFQKAAGMFKEAALLGDTASMVHYARHCLLSRMNDSARYWLKKSVASGEASKKAKWMLLRLRLGLRHNTEYLKPEEAPPTTGQKIKNILLTSIKIIWKALIFCLFIASILVVGAMFKSSTDPNGAIEFPSNLSSLLDMFEKNSEDPSADFEPVPVSPFEKPTMTRTAEGAYWSQSSVAYDETGAPVIFCYGKDLGGNLAIPLNLGEYGALYSAGVCFDTVWDIRPMLNYTSYDSKTKTVVIAEEYLMTLEPGEYFIVLNDSCYAPLLVTETTTFNSTQRGFAGYGNEIGWIENDLLNVQDITLHFYNLGDNTIRSITEVTPTATTTEKTAIDSQFYTISPDCRSVTILAAYWQQKAAGSFVTFEVRLANGDTLDLGYIHVGTVEGDYTSLMELTGPAFYSVSAGGDLVISYSDLGTPTVLSIYSDSQTDFVSDLNFIDFDSRTITVPGDMLKDRLTPGEFLYINVMYNTVHRQTAYTTLAIQVTW